MCVFCMDWIFYKDFKETDKCLFYSKLYLFITKKTKKRTMRNQKGKIYEKNDKKVLDNSSQGRLSKAYNAGAGFYLSDPGFFSSGMSL